MFFLSTQLITEYREHKLLVYSDPPLPHYCYSVTVNCFCLDRRWMMDAVEPLCNIYDDAQLRAS